VVCGMWYPAGGKWSRVTYLPWGGSRVGRGYHRIASRVAGSPDRRHRRRNGATLFISKGATVMSHTVYSGRPSSGVVCGRSQKAAQSGWSGDTCSVDCGPRCGLVVGLFVADDVKPKKQAHVSHPHCRQPRDQPAPSSCQFSDTKYHIPQPRQTLGPPTAI
jgi:hypothetical protein